jgi:putative endonuclease
MVEAKCNKVFSVYILRSMKDGKLYTGYSGNLKRRLAEHFDGKVKSTRNRRPLKLVFCKDFSDRSSACRFERYLKSPEGGKLKKEMIGKFRDSSFKI